MQYIYIRNFLLGRRCGLTGRRNALEQIRQGVRMAMVLPLLAQNLFEAGRVIIQN